MLEPLDYRGEILLCWSLRDNKVEFYYARASGLPRWDYVMLEHKSYQAREARPELAEITEVEAADLDDRNREVVLQLYEALGERDAERVQTLLAPDLEWWFHGPRSHQHMKRLLTGEEDNFHFVIHSVDAFGPTVIAEGTDLTDSVVWVHAWTVSDGIITQVREYFNTSLIVTRVPTDASSASNCLPVWESRLSINAGKSLPGLVLAL
ncbi:hypothetical protein IEQ34_005381 [Dendrobium chrysotoxum]|uniref:Wound-induced protein 1 n=1 Tax=Dendrobium chrysotoxum TaxID=161865 RepID=A0AAV7HCG8_DENCH|nr:hypothetical protein IEQ34_005381 [Dendrobium chrysotoxum]